MEDICDIMNINQTEIYFKDFLKISLKTNYENALECK